MLQTIKNFKMFETCQIAFIDDFSFPLQCNFISCKKVNSMFIVLRSLKLYRKFFISFNNKFENKNYVTKALT